MHDLFGKTLWWTKKPQSTCHKCIDDPVLFNTTEFHFLFSLFIGETGLCIILSTASYSWCGGIFSLDCGLSITEAISKTCIRHFKLLSWKMFTLSGFWFLREFQRDLNWSFAVCLACQFCAVVVWLEHTKYLCQWDCFIGLKMSPDVNQNVLQSNFNNAPTDLVNNPQYDHSFITKFLSYPRKNSVIPL